jgi:hypothetical protein
VLYGFLQPTRSRVREDLLAELLLVCQAAPEVSIRHGADNLDTQEVAARLACGDAVFIAVPLGRFFPIGARLVHGSDKATTRRTGVILALNRSALQLLADPVLQDLGRTRKTSSS